ncbi:phospholipase D-like domain-containing protein [Tsuneonella mangrovi]|uniref:phospholipase D-like domain-containing protein n=1 Tax=Tsuneonella mangrovi TaxID=1982042 RepID=UPI000BA1CC0E|nr:phosphatidylserine/phosphatidylglycerophosphate/cardiolipin synthase family protein [Tsuneonella mangrovi]
MEGTSNPIGVRAASASYHAERSFAVSAKGQDLVFHPGGPERREALISLIDSAEERLRLCFYIFAKDASGQAVRDALVAAARRGVDVQLIVDGFGADAGPRFFAPLVEAGGRFFEFSPRWGQRYLIRNHQKIAIADGREAMLGGFNIEDDYFASAADDGWNDLGVTVRGPVVADLSRWFGELKKWVASPSGNWLAIRRMVREWQPGSGAVSVVIGGPTRMLSTWARHVARDMVEADRLDMVMAYFSPPYWLMRRIGHVARRGEVRLVLAGKSDNGATIGAARSLYNYLLKRRARIWEFTACKLHEKLIVVGDVTYVGSANFDMRSLYLNLEIMLRIEDPALAERMREHIAFHRSGSEEITPSLHKRRANVFSRVRWWLAWFLVTVVDYTVTRRLDLGE